MIRSSAMPETPKAFAEIIESSLATCMAQCWNWEEMPSFGSLVTLHEEDQTILGIVSNIQTGSMDANRYPFPYKKTHAQLRQDHPQIFEFLKTTFTLNIVGSITQSAIRYALPHKPARIHTFVAPASAQTAQHFFSTAAFLPLLFATVASPQVADELFLAIIDTLAGANMLNLAAFEEYYQTFSLLTNNDYRRLKLLLQRVHTHHAKTLT